MFGIRDILQVAQIASLPMSFGTSALLQGAFQLALREVSTQAFSRALSQLGFSSQNQFLNAFREGFSAGRAFGNVGQELLQQVTDASYRSGGLAQSMDRLANVFERMIMEQGRRNQEESANATTGGGGSSAGVQGGSWLVQIARALGAALGDLAEKMVGQSKTLQSLAGDSSEGGAKKFQAAAAELQGTAQTFNILSETFGTVVKGIGEGVRSVAGRQ